MNLRAPRGVSAEYLKGWSVGNWWIVVIDSLDASTPQNWSEEKQMGFEDRLAIERERRPKS